ncbi:hypothetical protein ACFY8P_19815 [Streptomyces sp. NPDC012693]|uniref:hypothetical protein n=1 Tax=Streptomyces sp. NPDC012693 TaxID=3364844 RepID=UPI00367BB297
MRFRQHHLGRVLAAVGLMAGPLALAAAGPAAADVVEPFGERYEESLYGDFTTIGGAVRADRAGGHASGTGRVTVPPGAEVAYARLFWGGSDGTHTGPGGERLRRCALSGGGVTASPGDPATTAPVLRVGRGPAVPVSIDSMVTDPADTAGPHSYTGESDVTAAFEDVTGTDAPIAVTGLWAAHGRGCTAGWSLTVVHRFPRPDPAHAPQRRSVHVHGGHVLQRAASPATRVTVDGLRRVAGPVRVSAMAHGGEWKTRPGTFLVDGGSVVERPAGAQANLLVGEAAGAVPPGATSAVLTFSPSGATYVPSALALSVPVADPVPPDHPARTGSPAAGNGKPTQAGPTPPRAPVDSSPTPTPTATVPTPTPPGGTPAPVDRTPAPVDPTPPVTPEPATPVDPPPPAPGPAADNGDSGDGGGSGSMAETGGNGERLWLLGALALALAATGLVAKAAMRGRGD